MGGFNPAAALGNCKAVVQRKFSQNSNQKQTTYENRVARLVYPYEISPNDHTNNGYILAVLNMFGEEKHVKIMISDEAYQDQKKREEIKNNNTDSQFNGAYIDQRMKDKIVFTEENKEKKTKLIGLEGAVFSNKVEKIGGVEFITATVRRIQNVKYANKVEEGVFTASAFFDRESQVKRVSSIEFWGETPTPVSFDDAESIEKLSSYLEAVSKDYQEYSNGNKDVDMKPRLGFKFIASKVSHKENPATGEKTVEREIFDTSTSMDTLVFEDESGNTTYPPINTESLMGLIEGYKTYVLKGFNDEKGVIEKLGISEDEVLFEFATYKSFRTSTAQKSTFTIDENRKGIQFSPLYKMVNTPYFNSLNEEDPQLGKNHAVMGFIKISKDKINEETMTKQVQSLATNVYFGDIGGNILSFLRNKDGSKYNIVEKIKKRYWTPEQIKNFEAKKEENKLKQGDSASLSSSGLTPPSNLTLSAAPATDTESDDMENMFADTAVNTPVKEDTAKPENNPMPELNIDDDLPF